MVAVQENFPKLTPEEYLAWEEKQEIKHEYFDGEVYAMAGGTVNHGRVAVNFSFILQSHLRGNKCIVLNSDVKIKIQKSDKFVYPDISVTCDDRDQTAKNFISHPCLIVEVLSPSTEAFDLNGKFKLYQRDISLRDYVLVSADKVELDLYRKNDQDKWEIISYGAGDLVELESINLTFPIEQVFEGISF